MSPTRRVRLAVTAYLVVVVIGFVGYQLFEGATPLESLYMTIITVTTVGFGEVFEVSSAGRIFTIFLIVGGVVSVSYAALSLAEFVVEGHLRNIVERRRMDRMIAGIDRHVIICGFGRVGTHLAVELDAEEVPFVVVDDDVQKIEGVRELGYLNVEGDATAEHILEAAGIARARAVVACVDTDGDNVLVALTAKGMRPEMLVIGRIKADENEAKLRRAGADRVIAPATIGGRRIAQLLTRPVVADFLELVAGSGYLEYSFEEIPVREGSPLDGSTLGRSAIRETYGCTVLGVLHGEEQRLDTHPDVDAELHAGDVLIVIGAEREVAEMRRQFLEI